MKKAAFFIAVLLVLPWNLCSGQTAAGPRRTILAVGAHAGDMEISCGAERPSPGVLKERSPLV